MDSKYAIDFLMFSYFGDWERNPLYAAIDRAYRDATMRRALELKELNLNPKDWNLSEDDKKNIKNIRLGLEMAGAEIIRAYISKNITGLNPAIKLLSKAIKNQLNLIADNTVSMSNYDDDIPTNMEENYDDWHEKLCETLVKYYNVLYVELIKQWLPDVTPPQESQFSYGNAQKWVNMTMKNLLIMSIIKKDRGDSDVDWCDKIIDISECFHIPLDSYMFKAIEREMHISPSFSVNPEEKGKTTAWSKIGVYDNEKDDSYMGYQRTIRDRICKETDYKNPIEWEGHYWIEQAKLENDNFVKKCSDYMDKNKDL